MKHVNVVKQLLVQLIWLWQVKDCSPYVQSKFNAKNSELSAYQYQSGKRIHLFSQFRKLGRYIKLIAHFTFNMYVPC